MKRLLLNIVLAILLVGVIGLNWLQGRDLSSPNVMIMPDMIYSVPFDAYSATTYFRDGKTLQGPITQTVFRGGLPLPYDTTRQSAERAGIELLNPFSAEDEMVLRRGGAVYASFCQHCHGATGQGDGAVAQHGFPPPPSLGTEKTVTLPDGHIFHIITYGTGNMPAHGPQLTVADRWRAILYVRKLQQRMRPVPDIDSTNSEQL